jgi:hypothetical protein
MHQQSTNGICAPLPVCHFFGQSYLTSRPDRVPSLPMHTHTPACLCSCASPSPSSVSNARCSSHNIPSSARSFAAFLFDSIHFGDHDYANTCPSNPLYTFPLSWWATRLAKAPLAYLPSLHLSVSSRVERPVSMRFG